MVDKTTVTLWPPEHGAKPHIPIEAQPDQVERMKKDGWRDEDPNPKPDASAPDQSEADDPPGPSKQSGSGKKRSSKKVKNAEVSESSRTAD